MRKDLSAFKLAKFQVMLPWVLYADSCAEGVVQHSMHSVFHPAASSIVEFPDRNCTKTAGCSAAADIINLLELQLTIITQI